MKSVEQLFLRMGEGETAAWIIFIQFFAWPAVIALLAGRWFYKDMRKVRTEEEKKIRWDAFKAIGKGAAGGALILFTVNSIFGLLDYVLSPETKAQIAIKFFTMLGFKVLP